MDAQKAHFVTLWCAAISKFEKGLSRALAPTLTAAQYRVLASLALPEADRSTKARLAWTASMRPDEVEAALEDLAQASLVALPSPHDPRGAARLTNTGREALQRANGAVTEWEQQCAEALQPSEQQLLASVLARALTVPGSYYARHLQPGAQGLSPVQRVTVLHAIHQAMAHAIRKNTDLSLTDFRFLLELYPKKQRGDKRLRAREIVSYLRVGRSYVTTASLRLEQEGLIERIPDEQDARGILFRLTPQGAQAVQAAGDDIFVLLTSLFGNLMEDRRFLLLMKHWLRAEDEALAMKRP